MDRFFKPQDWKLIVEQLPIGFSYLDLDLRVVSMNAYLLDKLGLTFAEVEGKRCYEIRAALQGQSAQQAQPCANCRVPQAIATKQVQTFVNEVTPDLIIENTTIPILSDAGEVLGTAELVEDITQRTKAAAAMAEREAAYRTLANNLPGIVYRLYPGRAPMTFLNNMLEPMTGYAADELTSGGLCGIEPLILDEDRPRIAALLEDAIENDAPFYFEYRIRHKDGRIRHFSERGRPVAVDGTLSHIDGAIFDVTAQKEAEDLLKRSHAELEAKVVERTVELRTKEAQLRTLIDAIPDLVIFKDTEGRHLVTNRAMERFVGASPGALEGKTIDELLPPEAAEQCRNSDAVAMRAREPVHFEEYVGTGADRVVLDTIKSSIRDATGSLAGLVVVSRDITERKNEEETKERYATQLAELNRLKDLFLDIVRHDLINPLQVVEICHRHLKERGGFSEQTQRYVEGLGDAAARAIGLVEDASTFAQLEETDRVKFQRLDLLAVLARSLDGLRPLLGEDASRVKIASTGRYPSSGDPKLIELVFTNLMANAIKYSPAATPVQVHVADEGDDCYTVRVEDRGDGIPDGLKETIFERFVRGDNAGVLGVGLGLAIARRIVDLHRGDIWVEDNSEGGSVFVVRLPKASGNTETSSRGSVRQ